MGWEKRGKKRYFYTKEWVGGKCRSRYTGGGEVAVLIEQCEKGRRIERRNQKGNEEMQRAKDELVDDRLNELSEINQNLVDALFLINGYHQHKRQWRKKRK